MTKNLIILCGASGSGKSSWVRDNKLELLALSADDIRKMLGLTSYVEKHHKIVPIIKDHDDSITWKLFNKMLDYRMQQGVTTIIDNTNVTQMALDQLHKAADKYSYRVYIVDFMLKFVPNWLEAFDDETLKPARQELLNRNNHREKYPVPNRILLNQINDYGKLRHSMFYRPEDYGWFGWRDASQLTDDDIQEILN